MKLNYYHTVVLTGALFGTAQTVAADETNHWSFEAVPYLWLASIDTETRLPGVPPATPPGTDRFDTRISGGALLAAQARYDSVGLYMDFAWLRLDTDSIQPGPAFSSGNLQSDFIHVTTALTYTLPLQGKFHADVLAGARLWNANETLTYTSGTLAGFKTSGDKTWADPVIGANLSYDLSQNWSLVTKGTVGGFGVSADIAWDVFGGAKYRFNDWCTGVVGYRYLREKYSQDGFALNMTINGFLLGVGFQF